MVKVVFLGSRPLGKFALEFLLEDQNAEVVGVCVLDTYENNYWKSDPTDILGPKRLSLDDLYDIDFDIGISVNYWKIVPASLLKKPRLGFYNIHHSYNLTYRGLNIATQAIANARSRNQWYHGTTLHKMADRLDDGEIVASCSCEISEHDTAYSLFKRVELLSQEIIVTWFPRLLTQRIACAAPTDDYLYFSKSDLPDKDLSTIGDNLQLFDLARSFIFPPHEPAYVVVDGIKRYLTTEHNSSTKLFASAGDGRNVYVCLDPHPHKKL